MVALRCLLVVYIVWLIISYTASHLIPAMGSPLWPTGVWKRMLGLSCVQRWCGCECAWRKKAATLCRPNAQVKQLTSVTVGLFVFFFLLSNCYFYSGRQKHFHFNSLSALLMLVKNWYIIKMTSIVLGQNYKIKCVGNLFIYCYKVFFEERYAKKLLPTCDVYLKIFFHPGLQEYKKKSRYI